MLISDLSAQVIRRRERVKPVLVVFAVAECYEAFVLASVMPSEVLGRQVQCKTVIQDAFQIFDMRIILVEGICIEEGRRRKLFRVTHHDDAATSGNGSHRLACRHLRRLVEDDKVELHSARLDILRYRHRAHEHAWTHPVQEVTYACEEVTQRYAPASVLDVTLEDTHLGSSRGFPLQCRKRRCDLSEKFLSGQCLKVLAESSESRDLFLEQYSMEKLQLRLMYQDMLSVGLIKCLMEGILEDFRCV